MNNRAKAGTAAAVAAGVAAGAIGVGVLLSEPEGDTTSFAALIVADCGTATAPGLQHLPAQARAQARCRPGRRAYECAAIRVPEGETPQNVTSWRVVGEPVELAEHPCADSEACLIDMEECNGQPSIAGYVERLTGHRGEDEVWAQYFGICLGDGCRCAGDCVTGAPGVVESGDSTWQETFCAAFPANERCVEGDDQ